MNRPTVSLSIRRLALDELHACLEARIREKGDGAFVSIHEIRGVLRGYEAMTEEKYLEFKKILATMTNEQKWKLVEESFGMWAELVVCGSNNWTWVMTERT